MKACLMFQRRFTPVAHKIALELKKSLGVEEFCGYVYVRSGLEFLRNQKDINYGTLLLDEDLHKQYKQESVDWDYLSTLEKTYGIPNLWPYISIDRIIRYSMTIREYPYDTPRYTHEEMARILQVTARAIISMLENEKPDFVYMPIVSAMGNMLLYYIAKKKGIPVLVGAETRINRGYALSDNYKNFSWAEERFKKLLKTHSTISHRDQAKEYLESFNHKPETYLYVMKNFKGAGTWQKILTWFSPKNLFTSVKWYIKLTWKTFTRKQQDYSDESPRTFFIDKFKRKLRMLRGYNDLYDATDEQDNFVYYPLHYEPEIAIFLLAPHWTDQINVVKQIAQSVPINFKVYVKEHPAMVGYRPRRYYKELKKIPNVKLIEPNTNSFNLIKKSRLIATISGTAGWEGVLLGKPVVTFGDVYFNTLSMVKKCTVIDELPQIIKGQLDNFVYNKDELLTFIEALLEDSLDIRLYEMWEKGVDPGQTQKSLTNLCTLLGRKLKFKK